VTARPIVVPPRITVALDRDRGRKTREEAAASRKSAYTRLMKASARSFPTRRPSNKLHVTLLRAHLPPSPRPPVPPSPLPADNATTELRSPSSASTRALFRSSGPGLPFTSQFSHPPRPPVFPRSAFTCSSRRRESQIPARAREKGSLLHRERTAPRNLQMIPDIFIHLHGTRAFRWYGRGHCPRRGKGYHVEEENIPRIRCLEGTEHRWADGGQAIRRIRSCTCRRDTAYSRVRR